MSNWTALQVLTQVAGELGLPQPATVVGLSDVQSVQLLSLLQSSGNELLLYYPWEQFAKRFDIALVAAQEEYDLPADYSYFRDQTQWDSTNHWPLLGPKSAQEWAWLKNSFVATLPRMRYRIQQSKFKVFPVPPVGTTQSFYMEYISRYWVRATASTDPDKDMITLDTDVLYYEPWLLVKYVKFKFYELKGFKTEGVRADFLRVFESLTGKDTGAEKLSLAPNFQTPYIGAWSIPDGSWNV
jgi:hypothetical protein